MAHMTKKAATSPTQAQMALLTEMTLGGKTLKASPKARRSMDRRYDLVTREGWYVHTVSRAMVAALMERGLIQDTRESFYALDWTYRVTAAGETALREAMEPREP